MLKAKFGIEIEFTGITKSSAQKVVADYYQVNPSYNGEIKMRDGRTWRIAHDGSITCQRKVGGRIESASSDYACELVSPILTYQSDMDDLQELVRRLRKAGVFTNSRCGIHIHLDGSMHTPRSIRNFVNIIASKNDLFYKALEIESDRVHYCKALDKSLVEKMNQKKPKTLKQIEDIWYASSYQSRTTHYHDTRYHFLNLHSFFTRNHTVELRGFNSTLHAGKVRSYVVLALALNNQALIQKAASSKKPQIENERFAMRTYLNRIGFIGNDYKNCREHLCQALSGSAAWRFGAKASNSNAYMLGGALA